MSNLMNNIKNLREMTGAGFLDCKKALSENNNDLDTSVDFLRKKGLAKANKKSSREANEGAVGIYGNNYITSIIKINTETDFAAKNEIFLNFMDQIGNYILSVNKLELKIDDFKKMLFDDISIADHFKNIISKIGENIILSKLIIVDKNKDSLISSYVHNSYKKNIGKIAVIVKSKVNEINEDSKLFGKNLCMHIAASKPLALNIENLSNELIEKERKVQLESIKNTGKPDEIINKILKGKMKKYYSESTLLNQFYILDTDKTVEKVISDFSKKNNFKILDYKFIVLGN